MHICAVDAAVGWCGLLCVQDVQEGVLGVTAIAVVCVCARALVYGCVCAGV
jgi:hypothetical protein